MFIALPRNEQKQVVSEGISGTDEIKMWKQMDELLETLPPIVTHITLHSLHNMKEINALWRTQEYFKMRGFNCN